MNGSGGGWGGSGFGSIMFGGGMPGGIQQQFQQMHQRGMEEKEQFMSPYDQWGKSAKQDYLTMLQTHLQQIRANANRMGLTNSGFMNNMMTPAYQTAGQGMQGVNAQVAMGKSKAMMDWEQLQLMKRMEQEGGGSGGILGGLLGLGASLIPGVGPVVGAALPGMGFLGGSLLDQ